MKKDITKDLASTITQSGLADSAKEMAELGIDSLLEAGAFKDIPLINTVLGIFKAKGLAKDKLLFRSVYKFIENLESLPDSERITMYKKVESVEIDSMKLSEFVMTAIERLDLPTKATCLGELFKSYINSEITREEFCKYCFLVEKISLFDLDYISKNYSKTGKHTCASSATVAMGAGLLSIKAGPYISSSNSLEYEPTPDAQKFGSILERALKPATI